MEFLLILLLIIIVIVIYKGFSSGDKQVIDPFNQKHYRYFEKSLSGQNKYPYFKNNALLTPAEISFYHTLKIAVGDTYDINAKVRLADLVSVHKGLSKPAWSSAFNQIKAKHLDFVLVDRKTTEILCGIELDDGSHNRLNRRERDNFLDAALKSAGLPLLRFRADRAYNSNEIGEAIQAVLNSDPVNEQTSAHSVQKKVQIEPELNIAESSEQPSALKCPRCNAELVERRASKGRHAGVKFWGCSNFPKCRYRKVTGERG